MALRRRPRLAALIVASATVGAPGCAGSSDPSRAEGGSGGSVVEPGGGGHTSSSGGSSGGMGHSGGSDASGGAKSGAASGGEATSAGGAASGGSSELGDSGGAAPSAGGAPESAGGGSVNACPERPPLSGGTQYCSNGKGNAGSGYAYELWADGSGSGCMTVYGVDATFGATWSNVDDFLGRVGLDFNQTQTHQQIGTIVAEFAETKQDEGGLTYIGIYGWTVSPLREFYILDDWGMEKPGGFSSDGTPRDEVGTLVADGETYDVWKKTRENKPSIQGTATFDQYFSIRRTGRSCGTISVSEHFDQWEGLGLSLGNMYEIKWLVEAQANSGQVEFTEATISVH